MSNFICEKCGVEIIDSPNGYMTGCEHYPIEQQTTPQDKQGVGENKCAWKSFEGTFCPEADKQLLQAREENEKLKETVKNSHEVIMQHNKNRLKEVAKNKQQAEHYKNEVERLREALEDYEELGNIMSSYITFADVFKLMPKDVETAAVELINKIQAQQALKGGE